MTLRECTALLAPVALVLGAELDEADYRAYHRVLEDVPTRLLLEACNVVSRTPRGRYEPKFPTAPSFRAMAEQQRQKLAAMLQYEPCAACEHNCGWMPTGDGRVTRCQCWHAHQAKLASGGLSKPLALPAGEEVEA